MNRSDNQSALPAGAEAPGVSVKNSDQSEFLPDRVLFSKFAHDPIN